ncbi:MAG: 3-hydroxyacyl-CoA dehydrogenase NAD-binding domain-containing protein, partial [Halohasta sp.]
MDLEDVRTIAVLGAGNMGHGIAEVAALAGYDVRLRDINEELVHSGYETIEWSLDKLVEKDRLTAAEAEATRERIDPVVDVEAAVDEADVIVEAVPEVLDIKREVFDEVAEHAPEQAIFTTNTSSLSITELSEATDRPGRFCGMHFFNPPVRMELVEVIAGEHTGVETLELVEDLAESMDKTPVRVHKDSPGFIVNRVLIPLLNEAAWIVEEETATIAEVDATTKFDMGLPMGAFELADQVGIDVSYHVLEYMHETLGEAYRPCPLLEAKVDAEALGRKTGQGFYDYDDGGADIPPDAGRDDVADRLLALLANEVAGLIAEEVADAAAIDRAMQLGAGFPDGPAKMADDRGLESLVDTLDDRYEATDEPRYEAVGLLQELAADDGTFHGDTGDDASAGGSGSGDATTFETIRVDREGSVGRLTLDRPHRMNTVSVEMLDELAVAIDQLDSDDAVRCLLVTGAGDRAFCAGADVGSMASGADPLEGVDLSRKGQETFGKLEACETPVVAGVDGYCLGGGMEL